MTEIRLLDLIFNWLLVLITIVGFIFLFERLSLTPIVYFIYEEDGQKFFEFGLTHAEKIIILITMIEVIGVFCSYFYFKYRKYSIKW